MNWYEYYATTTYRLPEYLIGMAFGFVMYNMKNQPKISSRSILVSYLGWIAAVLMIYNLLYKNEPLKLFGSNVKVYQTVYRSIWSLSICWIVFACHQHKTGGLVRWFLHLRMWQPLSRIGLSIYVIHRVYINYTMNFKKKPTYGGWWTFTLLINDLIVSTILGALIYLFVEAPTSRILALIWAKKPEEKIEDSKQTPEKSSTLSKEI